MKTSEIDPKTPVRRLRQYWIIGVTVFFGVALLINAPAWAAPVPRPLGQTVPRPTATPGDNPVATATPRPDDNDNGGGGSSEQPDGRPGPVENTFTLPSTGSAAAPAAGYTAVVDVATLNVRQGSGTGFPIVGTLAAGNSVTVLSRSEDAAWWFVCCASDTGAQGWVSAQLLTPNFDRAQAAQLLTVFGSAPTAAASPTLAAGASAQTAAGAQLAAPLDVEFRLDPPFVWQGITGTLEIRIVNPNTAEATRVQLSNELPAALTLLETSVDGGGIIERIDTLAGQPLIIARWPVIPAGTGVSAAITFQVDSDLANGDVIDNLIALRGVNVAYQTDAITIGMPPVEPPRFE